MFEPVVTEDGHTYPPHLLPFSLSLLLSRYENASIKEWFASGHKTSPLTNQPLESTKTTPNIFAKQEIQHFLEENGIK
jgi:hypothetical protein